MPLTNVMRRQLKKISPTRPKKPFTVIEAACGSVPVGLVKKAQRALEKGKTMRKFVGVDEEKFDIDLLLKKTGLKALPSNLKLVESCASKYFQTLPKNSQDVIFASYLINNLASKQSCLAPGVSCEAVFLGMAKRVLRPGGKIVLIQDKAYAEEIKQEAIMNGMNASVIDIPEKTAIASKAEFIRLRATPKRRRVFVKNYYNVDSEKEKLIRKLIQHRLIKSKDEFARPTAIILTKPRNSEQIPKARLISIGDLGLSDRELHLVLEAINRMR
jgi:SAM-dependent methyltransferase